MINTIIISEEQLRYMYEALNVPFECETIIILENIFEEPDIDVTIELRSRAGDNGRFRGFALSYRNHKEPYSCTNIYSIGLTYESYEEFSDILAKVLSMSLYQNSIKGANEVFLKDPNKIKIITYKNKDRMES